MDVPGDAPLPSDEPEDELGRLMAEVRAAADEAEIRWQAPEGRFVTALLGVLRYHGRTAAAERSGLQDTLREGRQHVAREIEAARALYKSIEQLTNQTRTLHLLSVAEQETVLQRMMKETLPLFAEKLQGALVIRERRWNRRAEQRHYALAGLVALAVFVAGYGLCAWSDARAVAAMDRCLRSMVQSNGHTFCVVDEAFSPAQAP